MVRKRIFCGPSDSWLGTTCGVSLQTFRDGSLLRNGQCPGPVKKVPLAAFSGPTGPCALLERQMGAARHLWAK